MPPAALPEQALPNMIYPVAATMSDDKGRVAVAHLATMLYFDPARHTILLTDNAGNESEVASIVIRLRGARLTTGMKSDIVSPFMGKMPGESSMKVSAELPSQLAWGNRLEKSASNPAIWPQGAGPAAGTGAGVCARSHSVLCP